MVQLTLGIILLAAPFLLLTIFQDKKKGAVYILFSLLLFHTALAFLTQALGVFYYNIVISATVLADVFVLLIWRGHRKNLTIKASAVDWVLILIVIISFLSLYQVHYNYTGKVNFATDQTVAYHEVKNMKYVYPYFSDEWYAVLFIENSIDSHALPLTGFGGEYFLNIEMFFHSLVSEIMLILALDPLTQYTLISIFANILIVALGYIFLRINNVSKLSAGVASLFILYIASGANLPGIWNFIPLHLGIIFCLIGFCFLSSGNFRLAASALLLVLIFYAPLIIFYGTALLVFCLFRFNALIKKHGARIAVFAVLTLAASPVAYVGLAISPFAGALDFVLSKVFYTSFYGSNLNPDFAFYNIIPLVAIFFALLGLRAVWENSKWLLSVLFLGAIFWIFYFFTTSRFFIEYERIVFFASILACVISGFGLNYIELIAGKFKNAFKILQAGLIVSFLLLAPFYTQAENWKKFVVRDIGGGTREFFPKAPANNYLTQEDLRVFEGINNKRFLSVPWKGTVIGVTTNNFPLAIKDGTISMGRDAPAEFLFYDCGSKAVMAEREKIDYVYLPEFDCPQFKEINKSGEGFNLYEVIN